MVWRKECYNYKRKNRLLFRSEKFVFLFRLFLMCVLTSDFGREYA
jgi:hypothetical protein